LLQRTWNLHKVLVSPQRSLFFSHLLLTHDAHNVKAGTTHFLNSLLDAFSANNIPVIFSMTRRHLASAIVHTKEVAVTCVGILSFEGAENLFSDVLAATELLAFEWKEYFVTGPNPLIRNENPIWIACKEGYRDPIILQKCVASGWSPDEVDSVNGDTPLITALKGRNRIVACNLLAMGGLDVSLRNFGGQTAIHVACESGDDVVLNSIFGTLGDRAKALSRENLHLFQKLISQKSYAGLTPLMYAANELHPSCVQVLLEWATVSGCERDLGLELVDPAGSTPLSRAAEDETMLRTLLPQLTVSQISQMIFLCARSGSDKSLRLLLPRLSALIHSKHNEIPSSSKVNLKQASAKFGQMARTEYLAVINSIGDNEMNALDLARCQGHEACCRLLEDAGAIPSSQFQ
jgi:ankyrin repeat protein